MMGRRGFISAIIAALIGRKFQPEAKASEVIKGTGTRLKLDIPVGAPIKLPKLKDWSMECDLIDVTSYGSGMFREYLPGAMSFDFTTVEHLPMKVGEPVILDAFGEQWRCLVNRVESFQIGASTTYKYSCQVFRK